MGDPGDRYRHVVSLIQPMRHGRGSGGSRSASGGRTDPAPSGHEDRKSLGRSAARPARAQAGANVQSAREGDSRTPGPAGRCFGPRLRLLPVSPLAVVGCGAPTEPHTRQLHET